MSLRWPVLVLALPVMIVPCVQARQAASPPSAAPGSAVEEIRKEARALEPLARSDLAKRFLKAASALPSITPRKLWRNESKTTWYREDETARLTPEERGRLTEVTYDETYYYNTRYGTPLAYARALDILAESGLSAVGGARILDFGYGGIGHLRILASLGADVVGVEVDPLLRALYSHPGDQGTMKTEGGRDGTLVLVHGQFPATEEVRRAVGTGFDLIVAKNVLKNGYIHPAEPVDPRRLVHLGLDDETFVGALFAALKPGGRLLIYNLCPAPAPAGKPYIPWADGRSPFPRRLWEAAGFTVSALDANDDPAARAMGRALGWDKGDSPMDLDKDLFGIYTLVQRPR